MCRIPQVFSHYPAADLAIAKELTGPGSDTQCPYWRDALMQSANYCSAARFFYDKLTVLIKADEATAVEAIKVDIEKLASGADDKDLETKGEQIRVALRRTNESSRPQMNAVLDAVLTCHFFGQLAALGASPKGPFGDITSSSTQKTIGEKHRVLAAAAHVLRDAMNNWQTSELQRIGFNKEMMDKVLASAIGVSARANATEVDKATAQLTTDLKTLEQACEKVPDPKSSESKFLAHMKAKGASMNALMIEVFRPR